GPYRLYFMAMKFLGRHPCISTVTINPRSFGSSRFPMQGTTVLGLMSLQQSRPWSQGIGLYFWRHGMGILAPESDESVKSVVFDADILSVTLCDGRTITVPRAWYPRLLHASDEQRSNWQVPGGGYGIHWPEVDEDPSTEGLLRGAPAPKRANEHDR